MRRRTWRLLDRKPEVNAETTNARERVKIGRWDQRHTTPLDHPHLSTSRSTSSRHFRLAREPPKKRTSRHELPVRLRRQRIVAAPSVHHSGACTLSPDPLDCPTVHIVFALSYTFSSLITSPCQTSSAGDTLRQRPPVTPTNQRRQRQRPLNRMPTPTLQDVRQGLASRQDTLAH